LINSNIFGATFLN